MRFAQAVKISDLKPWRNNPRKHDADIAALVRSVEHFGWTNPILAQEGSRRVIAGHGRLEAAKQAGLKSVPVIFLKMSTDDATAYTIADNKLAELSSWDDVALANVLEEMQHKNFDLSLLGFSDDDLNQLLTRETESLERTTLDDVPAVPKKATTKPGQLYKLGDSRLLCGDSTDRAQVSRAMAGHLADLVFTDPPYGIDYVGKTPEALTMRNDNLSDAGTLALVTDAARVWPLKPGGGVLHVRTGW
jgi:ParB/RepB/Spo0J family partition protein